MTDNEILDNVTAEPQMVEQQHANKIAQAAYARGVKAAESELRKEIEELKASIGLNKNSSINEEELLLKAELRASERAKKEAQEEREAERYKKLANGFEQKIQKGRESFEDFDEKVKKFNPKVYPHFAMAIAEVDEGEEILYHLLDRGIKISQINQLLKEDPGSELAKDEMRKVLNSIKKNKEGKAQFKPTSAPLSKVNPSNSGLSKGGTRSVEQLKSSGFYRF